MALDGNGRPVSGVEITWTVTSGGGAIEPEVSTTGSDGVATATHFLDGVTEIQTVTASADGLDDVEFSATAADPPTSGTVSLQGESFSPRNVAVQVGGTVTWTWAQPIDHNVIFTSGPTPRPPDSPTQNGGTYAVTFNTVAVFEYVCTLHANMNGVVHVVN